MKKIICLTLSLLLLAGLFTGCGSTEPTQEPVQEPTAEETVTQEAAPEASQPQQTLPADPVPQEPENSLDGEIKLQMGQEYQYDLDGDGTAESILCSYTPAPEYGQTLSVLINGTECNSYNTRIWDDLQDYYYLVDLYTNDTWLELAFLDAGPSSDPISVFYYYHDTMLEECGALAGFVGSQQVTIHGDSTVTSIKRLQILQTWWGWTSWVVNENHTLEEMAQELYTPTQDSNVHVTLAQELSVFMDRDPNAERTTLPAGTELTLTATDNESWVCAEAGVTPYWIYLPEGWEIDTGSGTVWPDEIISGLIWAD